MARISGVNIPLNKRVEIGLNHLTAVAYGGLIRLVAASDAPYLLKTEVTCANSFPVTTSTLLTSI